MKGTVQEVSGGCEINERDGARNFWGMRKKWTGAVQEFSGGCERNEWDGAGNFWRMRKN